MEKIFKVVKPRLVIVSHRYRSCFPSLSYYPETWRILREQNSLEPKTTRNRMIRKNTGSPQYIHINKRFCTTSGGCAGTDLKSIVLTEAQLRKIKREHDRVVSELNEIDQSIKGRQGLDSTEEEDQMAKGLVEICENYSKAHGSYVAWETDVNLSPPKSWRKPAPDGDRYLHDYYASLQYTLYETGHPGTIDRTLKPRAHQNKEHVNAVLLSSPVECIGILLEGGKQVPDGFHLVLSPSWLSKVPSDEDDSLDTLLLHKSISFHSNGATFIDEYDPPRKVTYFVNYFTENVTSGQRNDGIEIEERLDCPMSSSIKLCELVDDKVWTRDIMAEVGMEIPETLAFRRMPARRLTSGKNKIKTVDFESYASLDVNSVEKEIKAFSEKLKRSNIGKIVVKPSGPRYLGSVGVSLHRVSDVTSIVRSAEELLLEIEEGSSVLVEEFIDHLIPNDSEDTPAPLWSADSTLGFRVRSTVCRDHDDTPVTTLINCAIADKTQPINGDNSVCQSLDSTLLAYNITDKRARKKLDLDIRTQSADVLKVIMEREKNLSVGEKGAHRGQTDVIGIDMIVTVKGGKLVPVGIEANSHDCTINTQLYDFMINLGEKMLIQRKPERNIWAQTFDTYRAPMDYSDTKAYMNGERTDPCLTPDSADIDDSFTGSKIDTQQSRYYCGDSIGQSVRPFVRNMIKRSQLYVMKGKQIVVIGGGGISKRSIWPDAAEYGLKVILVDSSPDHLARDQVHRFIHYDFDDHKKDFAHACNIVNLIHTKKLHVDGCVTFWEDCVPLAALVSEMIGTRGSSFKAALTGKKKSRTQHVLNTRKGDIPHWPRTYLYSSKSVHIESDNDSLLVPKSVEFPIILKLEHGSSAVGVSVVKDEVELRNKYHEISESLQTESDFPGIGLGHDNSMIAMEFHTGSEHDVDVIMYDRKLVGAFISDNGPTRRPYFTETAAVMPSSLPTDKQAQLIAAAYQCCTEIGLSDGTFNVELLMTKTGPKLIEINARMGGFYLRDWIRRIYGVDLMLYSFMIASGVKPYVPKHPADTYLVGVMLIPSEHSNISRKITFKNTLNELMAAGEVVYTELGESSELPFGDFEEPFANIAVLGTTVQKAKAKLLNISRYLGVHQEHYQVEQFLKHF